MVRSTAATTGKEILQDVLEGKSNGYPSNPQDLDQVRGQKRWRNDRKSNHEAQQDRSASDQVREHNAKVLAMSGDGLSDYAVNNKAEA